MNKQQIVYVKLSDIKPYKNNAKKHSKEQVEKLAKSIKEFGFKSVVVLDKNNEVIAGHGRCYAAKKAGLKEIPCIYADDLTDEQIKAYRLIDNKLNESDWDKDILDSELDNIFDIDMEGFGFSVLSEIENTSNEYTTKTLVPQYEITGIKPNFKEMVDTEKYKSLIEKINNSNVSEREKKFLRLAASRHIVFNFSKIAEYYANVASKEMQELMEEQALVIIDFDDAIRYGYIELMEDILRIEGEDEA